MIKRFAQCLREYKWTALVSPACMIGEVAMEVTIPLVMADLYDYGIAMSNMAVVWQKALQLLLCALASLPVRRLCVQGRHRLCEESAPRHVLPCAGFQLFQH